MYLIVTTSSKVAEEAMKSGAIVFRDTKLDAMFKASTVSVEQIMAKLAIKPNLKGYDYIKYIMNKCEENPAYHKKSLMKVIYPECAEAFDATVSKVERAIRHAIERSFEAVPERYFELYQREIEKVPTNSEFISMISEILNYYSN